MTRIAISGLREIGMPLAHYLARDGRLSAVNDINPESLSGFKQYGIDAFSEPDISEIPWSDLDCIVESSRLFDRASLEAHAEKAAKVIMTGDLREGEPDFTYVIGVNENIYNGQRIVCASSDRVQALGYVLYLLDFETHYGPALQINVKTRRPPYLPRTDLYEGEDKLTGLLRAWPDDRDRLEGRIKGYKIYDPKLSRAEITLTYRPGIASKSDELSSKIHERLNYHLQIEKLIRKFFLMTEKGADLIPDKAVINPADIRHDMDFNTISLKITYDPVKFYLNVLSHILKKVCP